MNGKIISVKTNEHLSKLICDYHWNDAFIKEVYCSSESYFNHQTGGTAQPDSPLSATFIIVFTSHLDGNKCIEMLFKNATSLEFASGFELEPAGEISRDYIDFSFGTAGLGIRAHSLSYRVLDDELAGAKFVFNSSVE